MISRVMSSLLREVIDGPTGIAWLLNPGDQGLLRSLDALTADDASRVPANGGSSIAAHVDHLCYGLEQLIAWRRGRDLFAAADYSASWRRQQVSPEEWAALRALLRERTRMWIDVASAPSEMSEDEAIGVVASLAHLAYHLGTIRQIDRATRGPAARD